MHVRKDQHKEKIFIFHSLIKCIYLSCFYNLNFLGWIDLPKAYWDSLLFQFTFIYFMLWLLVQEKTTLPWWLIVTLITFMSYSFMFRLLVFNKITLQCCLKVTLITFISYSFMFWLLVFNKFTLPCCLIVTLVAFVSYSFMCCLLVLNKICLLIPSCFDFLCLTSSPFCVVW